MNSTLSSAGSKFYCHACADGQGLLVGLHLTSSSPSSYQTEKAAKHSGPTSTSTGINSVLNSGSTSEYDSLAQLSLQNGFVEVEPSGCRSLVYVSTGYLGTQFNSTSPSLQLDSFRWVLSTESSLAHGRPDSSTRYSGVKCTGCGANVY